MALYIPHSIFHLARILYVRPETFWTLLRTFKTEALNCSEMCVNSYQTARRHITKYRAAERHEVTTFV